MTSTQLPPLNFDDGGLRIVLLPEVNNGVSSSFASYFDEAEKRTSYPRLSPSQYLEPNANPFTDAEVDDTYESGIDEAEQPLDPPSSDPSIPKHPIPELQDAFAESLREVMSGIVVEKPRLRALDTAARREALLAQGQHDPPFDASWRLREGQEQHEIAKLVAQISFGVYLLLNGMANNNSQVISILQGHIDEVDEFLEVTIEDLAQAEKDLQRRIDHLLLPMSNIEAFEQLLEDRKFRTEILEGNEKIEHILARTNVVMKQWDTDTEVGLRASKVFIHWLNDHKGGSWTRDQPDMIDVFEAMNGNAEGWLLAFEKISDGAQDISNLIIRLMNMISEMEKKAGEVSRRTWATITPFSPPPSSITSQSATSPPSSSHQSLPRSNGKSSILSGSSSGFRPSSTLDDYDDDDDAATIEFPMPATTPLVPPLRSMPFSPDSATNGRFHSPHSQAHHVHQSSLSDVEDVESEEDEEIHSAELQEPIFLLQPRTYTPQPPAPLPSPRVKDERVQAALLKSPPEPRPESRTANSAMRIKLSSRAIEENEAPLRKPSLRERIALKTNPPESIHIPPQSLKGMEMYANSPSNSTPKTVASSRPDTAQGSRGGRQPAMSVDNSGLSTPIFTNSRSSPRSDHQRYYHPIIASPHSPLQQRPHTAAGIAHPMHHQSSIPGHSHHLRNKPSNLGAASMLSNVTTVTYDDRSTRTATPTGRQLKKKKSAFGWFKKAFSMDDEERAAFEARKAVQYQNDYYNSSTPKFLDGRRVR